MDNEPREVKEDAEVIETLIETSEVEVKLPFSYMFL